jgi:hypothetical protein
LARSRGQDDVGGEGSDNGIGMAGGAGGGVSGEGFGVLGDGLLVGCCQSTSIHHLTITLLPLFSSSFELAC